MFQRPIPSQPFQHQRSVPSSPARLAGRPRWGFALRSLCPTCSLLCGMGNPPEMGTQGHLSFPPCHLHLFLFTRGHGPAQQSEAAHTEHVAPWLWVFEGSPWSSSTWHLVFEAQSPSSPNGTRLLLCLTPRGHRNRDTARHPWAMSGCRCSAAPGKPRAGARTELAGRPGRC